MELRLSEISKLLKCQFDESLDREINEIKIDSRNISQGDIFVAIKGENFDGHDFVSEAFNNGAIACIVEKDLNFDDTSRFLFRVENSIEFMQKIASFYRLKFDVRVVGITGSVGKTTVKEMLSSIFSFDFNTIKSEGNQNGQIGLPLSIFNLTRDTQVAVFEMGVSYPGEMKILANMAKPDFAVINNIGMSHVGNFGSLENTVREKYDICCASNCKLFVNVDNVTLSDFFKDKDENIVYFGVGRKSKYRVENINFVGDNITEFLLVTPFLQKIIRIPCFGMNNVYNALASISVALDFGMHIDNIAQGIMNFKPIAMRQRLIKLRDFMLVDDSYNASPDSIRASINYLSSLKSDGRCIAVIADILELGIYTEDVHHELGKYISSSSIDILITVGKYSKYINEGVMVVNPGFNNIHFESNGEAYEYICEILRPGDKILVKGSRGMKADEIVDNLIKRFGDGIEKS